MFLYGDYYLLHKLKRNKGIFAWLVSAVSYLLQADKDPSKSMALEIRAAPTFPSEPAPTNATVNTLVAFRDGSAIMVWDATNEEYINPA